MHKINNKYEIGSKVYHVCGETNSGYVVDIKYTYRSNQIEYLVVFNHQQESLWYYENELCSQPVYN